MSEAPLRIVQISDIHLFGDQDKNLLGVKTHDSFHALVNLLARDQVNASFILATGDLSQDGSEKSYIELADTFAQFKIPVYCIPGNHDDSNMMAKIYPRAPISNLRHIVLKDWQIILLDSQKPGAVEGFLDAAQLNFLTHCLQMYPEHHAMVCFHHHPVPIGTVWLDNLGLTNADALWQVLSGFPKVSTILFGHVHMQHEVEKNGIRCYSTPSTCIQFKKDCTEFALDELPPAYRIIDLYADGTLKTEVRRLDHYVGTFEKTAKGY